MRNARQAMYLAEQWLGVAQLLTPEQLVSPDVGELPMMTYLAQFREAKLKEGAPIKKTSDAAEDQEQEPPRNLERAMRSGGKEADTVQPKDATDDQETAAELVKTAKQSEEPQRKIEQTHHKPSSSSPSLVTLSHDEPGIKPNLTTKPPSDEELPKMDHSQEGRATKPEQGAPRQAENKKTQVTKMKEDVQMTSDDQETTVKTGKQSQDPQRNIEPKPKPEFNSPSLKEEEGTNLVNATTLPSENEHLKTTSLTEGPGTKLKEGASLQAENKETLVANLKKKAPPEETNHVADNQKTAAVITKSENQPDDPHKVIELRDKRGSNVPRLIASPEDDGTKQPNARSPPTSSKMTNLSKVKQELKNEDKTALVTDEETKTIGQAVKNKEDQKAEVVVKTANQSVEPEIEIALRDRRNLESSIPPASHENEKACCVASNPPKEEKHTIMASVGLVSEDKLHAENKSRKGVVGPVELSQTNEAEDREKPNSEVGKPASKPEKPNRDNTDVEDKPGFKSSSFPASHDKDVKKLDDAPSLSQKEMVTICPSAAEVRETKLKEEAATAKAFPETKLKKDSQPLTGHKLIDMRMEPDELLQIKNAADNQKPTDGGAITRKPANEPEKNTELRDVKSSSSASKVESKPKPENNTQLMDEEPESAEHCRTSHGDVQKLAAVESTVAAQEIPKPRKKLSLNTADETSKTQISISPRTKPEDDIPAKNENKQLIGKGPDRAEPLKTSDTSMVITKQSEGTEGNIKAQDKPGCGSSSLRARQEAGEKLDNDSIPVKVDSKIDSPRLFSEEKVNQIEDRKPQVIETKKTVGHLKTKTAADTSAVVDIEMVQRFKISNGADNQTSVKTKQSKKAQRNVEAKNKPGFDSSSLLQEDNGKNFRTSSSLPDLHKEDKSRPRFSAAFVAILGAYFLLILVAIFVAFHLEHPEL